MSKLAHPKQSPRWYGTTEVALILDTSEWRVKNFGLPTYKLDASIKAKGPGTRRRYSFSVVLRLAVASELYSAHINPAGIRDVLELLKQQETVERWIALQAAGEPVPEMVLSLDSKLKAVEENGKKVKRIERVWKVLNANQASAVATSEVERGSVAVTLDLVQLWERVVQRITDLEAANDI